MLARFLGHSRWEIAATLFLVCLDVAHWFAFEPLNRALRRFLLEPSPTSVWVLLGLYTAYIAATFFIKRLKPDSGDEKPKRWQEVLFLYPTFGFGILLVTTCANVSGMADDNPPISEDLQGGLMVGAVLLFLVHAVVAAMPMKPKIDVDRPDYLLTLVPTMLISELMLNLSVGIWYLFFLPESPIEDPSKGLSFAFGAPLFLLCFAAPRFTLLSRSFTITGLASGLALALYELWQLLDETPLL